MMYEWIVHNGYEPVIVATKLDKINRSQRQRHVRMVREGLKARPGTVLLPFSAQTKEGREELWALIEECLEDR